MRTQTTEAPTPYPTTGSVTLEARGGRVLRVEDLGPARTRLYLAGPMTGLPFDNYPAFHSRAKALRALGYHVANPAEVPDGDYRARRWADWMRRSIRMLTDCDTVAVLPGWHQSSGATLEVHLARQLSMPVLCAETLEPLP